MIFDYTIGNPPYQVDKTTESNNNANNIFHLFYMQGYDQSENCTVIFPAGRWMQRSVKGAQAAQQIYPTVKHINFYPNSVERNTQPVFPSVKVTDGVCIVKGDHDSCNHVVLGETVFRRPGETEILPLGISLPSVAVKTITHFDKSISTRKLPRAFFGLLSHFTERNPDKVYTGEFQGSVVAYLANANKGVSKRVEKFYIDKDSVQWDSSREEVYGHYKVCAPQAMVSKHPQITKYKVVESDAVVGESWIIVGHFATEEEAVNYSRYLDTNIVRLLLNESKGGKTKTWGYFVPDLGDYTSGDSLINWDEPLEKQLYDVFRMEFDEIFEAEISLTL